MLVRNVGHHMMTDMVTVDGQPAYESAVDALITVTAALHDLNGARKNSPAGSVYVVKPKMHGPDEVALAVRLFDLVEDHLGLPRNTVKMGIMDEERRTSANLKACIFAARDRVVFINTGFLDRTGDEIHTAMEAGPVMRKDAIKAEPWLPAYEKRNVEIGLAAGFPGRAQIGKGMWAAPDMMMDMLDAKVGHPKAGREHRLGALADRGDAARPALSRGRRRRPAGDHGRGRRDDRHRRTADPAAGPLQLEPRRRAAGAGQQRPGHPRLRGPLDRPGRRLLQGARHPRRGPDGGPRHPADLQPAHRQLAAPRGLHRKTRCARPWRRMAKVVDGQNADDPLYTPMDGNPDSIAFQAALELVFEGRAQPNGYTEHVLTRRRRERKAQIAGA